MATLKAAARKEFPILEKFQWFDGIPVLQAPGLVSTTVARVSFGEFACGPSPCILPGKRPDNKYTEFFLAAIGPNSEFDVDGLGWVGPVEPYPTGELLLRSCPHGLGCTMEQPFGLHPVEKIGGSQVKRRRVLTEEEKLLGMTVAMEESDADAANEPEDVPLQHAFGMFFPDRLRPRGLGVWFALESACYVLTRRPNPE